MPDVAESVDTQKSEERYKQVLELTRKLDNLRLEFDTLKSFNEELKSQNNALGFSNDNLRDEKELHRFSRGF